MIYNFLQPEIPNSHVANLLHYLTLRSGLAFITSLLICLIITPHVIKYLRTNYTGQPIRTLGPETHFNKAGTPTMGGLIMLVAITISTLLFANLATHYVWIALFITISFGALGLIDDYMKLTKNHHDGISAKSKLFWQVLISIIACSWVQYANIDNFSGVLTLPFFKNFILDLGYFYFPFCAFVIVAWSNAVNLTDGLDGLAAVPIAIAAICLGVLAYVVGHAIYAPYLQVIYIPHSAELAVFCASIFGAAIGFLWYNSHPAEIFMGDTGSLALGGALGIVSVILKHEVVFAIIGGLFVIETISVIIQVYYFKATGGRRFFKMAPLHHHFEKKGWPESKVVLRFWIIALVFGLIGLATLKLR